MTARELAIKIIKQYDSNDEMIDHILSKQLSQHDLSKVDKRLTNELVNGTLRWRIKIDWVIARLYRGKFEKLPRLMRIILEVSIYQLLMLDKVPEYAAINEAVNITKKTSGQYWGNLVNAILRSFLRKKRNIEDSIDGLKLNHSISVKYSHPLWMIDRWLKRYGIKETRELCSINNDRPTNSLRVNLLKTSIDDVIKGLQEDGIEVEHGSFLDEFIHVKNLPDLNQYASFQKGYFSVQDESAGLVSHLVDPQPGEKILDLCAAPGGKATHMAELSPESIIFGVDLYHQRLTMIRQNIQRLGLKNIHLICADARHIEFKNVDKILTDVPCSGLGVLAKRSDLRYKRKLKQIGELAQLQYEILNNASRILKNGGSLIYSTCTIAPEENERMIEAFLEKNPNFGIAEPDHTNFPENLIVNRQYIQTLPHIHKIDGSFSIKLIKRD